MQYLIQLNQIVKEKNDNTKILPIGLCCRYLSVRSGVYTFADIISELMCLCVKVKISNVFGRKWHIVVHN